MFDPTADFILEHIDIPQVSVLTPFPGTALHGQLEREGRILHRDWSRYDITHVVFRPARMSPAELEAGYRRVTARVEPDTRGEIGAAPERELARPAPPPLATIAA